MAVLVALKLMDCEVPYGGNGFPVTPPLAWHYEHHLKGLRCDQIPRWGWAAEGHDEKRADPTWESALD